MQQLILVVVIRENSMEKIWHNWMNMHVTSTGRNATSDIRLLSPVWMWGLCIVPTTVHRSPLLMLVASEDQLLAVCCICHSGSFFCCAGFGFLCTELCLTIFSLLFISGFFQSRPYHPNLRYYEFIDSSAFSHHIVKRGTKESNHRFNKIKEVQFSALGR